LAMQTLRNYCVRVLRNDNWGTKIIEYDNYYAVDGKMFKKRYYKTILIKTQEE